MKKLAIIPAYNEEGNIEAIVKKIRMHSPDFDIVVINDCSTDNTKSKAEGLAANVISLPINLGIGGAVQTGFKYAYYNNYQLAVQVDGDGQHNPKYLEDLIKPLVDNKADVVIGSRFIAKRGFQSMFFRRLGIRIFQLLYKILIREIITDGTSGFRAYNAKAIELLKDNYPTDYPEPEAIIILRKNKIKILEVAVEMDTRHQGISSITGFKTIYYMIKVTMSILIEYLRSYNG